MLLLESRLTYSGLAVDNRVGDVEFAYFWDHYKQWETGRFYAQLPFFPLTPVSYPSKLGRLRGHASVYLYTFSGQQLWFNNPTCNIHILCYFLITIYTCGNYAVVLHISEQVKGNMCNAFNFKFSKWSVVLKKIFITLSYYLVDSSFIC